MLFVKIGYTKNLTAAQKSTKYIAFRSREGGLGAFDEHRENADIKGFNRNLKDRFTSHPEAPKVYKVVISLSGDEYKKMGINYREFLRNTLSNYEVYSGRKLTWIASEHMNCGHPHIHLLIKPTYQDRHGLTYRLNLNKYEFTQFKNFLTHSYDTSVNYSTQYQQFIQREKLDIVAKRMAKNITRVLVRGNSSLYMLYGIYSLVKLKMNQGKLQKHRGFMKWVRKQTYGSNKYMDFKKMLKGKNAIYNSINIELDHKDRKAISKYLNSKDLKWMAIEKETGTRVAVYPFDKNKNMIKPEQVKEISTALSRSLRGR